MSERTFVAAAGLIAALGLIWPTAANAETNMLFILDGSNSMWGQIEGVAKIRTAKEVLSNLILDMPANTKVGLMAYGHRKESDCKDVEILSGIGSESVESLVTKVTRVNAKGKTPIAYALRQSAAAFADRPDANNHVILISDGVETCKGDPCAAAKDLVSQGIDIKVHVVGFDVSAEERRQLACISENGNGQYFEASNAASFKEAVAEVQQVAQAASEPAPAEKGPKEIFRDDFDGDDLDEHWEVLNPNPDSFIVEDGQLLMIAGQEGTLEEDTVENLLRLNVELPGKEWTATAKITFELSTGAEWIGFGLYQDKDNFVLGGAHYAGGCCPNDRFNVHAVKATRGKIASFAAALAGGGYAGLEKIKNKLAMPLYLRLTRKGRSFVAAAKAGDSEESKWVELEKLTSLRAKGGLAFLVTQNGDASGETTFLVDWIKVEAPQ